MQSPAPPAGFVALSRFTAANGMTDQVKRALGEGSTFKVILPLAPAPAE